VGKPNISSFVVSVFIIYSFSRLVEKREARQLRIGERSTGSTLLVIGVIGQSRMPGRI
jgi:hypothetical protein